MNNSTQSNRASSAQLLGMTCEYGNCQRPGCDYKRPKHLAEAGWEDEPIHLCEDHAKELKVTEK